MEISWKWLNLCLGLLFFQLCNGFPINLEDSVVDQHTQLLTGLVAVLLTVCSVVLLAGCLCCQRKNGFKEFRDSPVVASTASNLDHGHVNPIANGEFTIFTPLSSSPYNNNVFLANERIITRTAEDFVYEDFDVSTWFNEAEKDFPRIKLKYIKELGKGWFGKVVEGAAKEVPPNEEAWTPVVVRILEATASRKERVLFLNDAAIYRCGTHPNVLSLIGRCLDTVPLLLLQEYCTQGDLKNYLRSKRENVDQLLSSDYPLLWCCQLTSALKQLHSNGVVHPDLATRNCQLTADLTLKLGDYGLAESKYPEDYYQGTPRVPVRWCSPESLTCTLTTIQPKKTTAESNIWALAVTIWEICECGEQPYTSLSNDEVVSQVLGPPNIRLPRPRFPIIYTDYLYRLMQLCWSNFESRPTASQIDLMLLDLWQVYKNTKSNSLSADDFDKRWESFRPNSVTKNDNVTDTVEIEMSETNIAKPLSPSLNNLHGSLDNLLDSGDQMEFWLENVTRIDDFPFAKNNSNVVLSVDDPLVSEISSSESSDRTCPRQKKSKLKSKIDFDFHTKFRDSNFKQPYNFSDSALFSQRTSSESETEDENWRKKVERGAYTEKVRLKSRSVADLMILTHVDYSESESETPLPSLDYRVNYKNVRYAPKNNLENVSLTYGSEGNLLSVHDTFQEELKKLKEERRDSLLFVPDNHSQTSFNKLDSINTSNYNIAAEESNLNNMSVIDPTSKRLMHELNRVAEMQPANQVFNVFSVTIDKFKPIHVNSCKLNDIINLNDIDPCCMLEQNDKVQMLCEEPETALKPTVDKSPLHANDIHSHENKTNSCDINGKDISDEIFFTYPPVVDIDHDHIQSDQTNLYQFVNNVNVSQNDIHQTNTLQNNDMGCSEVETSSVDLKNNSILKENWENLYIDEAVNPTILKGANILAFEINCLEDDSKSVANSNDLDQNISDSTNNLHASSLSEPEINCLHDETIETSLYKNIDLQNRNDQMITEIGNQDANIDEKPNSKLTQNTGTRKYFEVPTLMEILNKKISLKQEQKKGVLSEIFSKKDATTDIINTTSEAVNEVLIYDISTDSFDQPELTDIIPDRTVAHQKEGNQISGEPVNHQFINADNIKTINKNVDKVLSKDMCTEHFAVPKLTDIVKHKIANSIGYKSEEELNIAYFSEELISNIIKNIPESRTLNKNEVDDSIQVRNNVIVETNDLEKTYFTEAVIIADDSEVMTNNWSGNLEKEVDPLQDNCEKRCCNQIPKLSEIIKRKLIPNGDILDDQNFKFINIFDTLKINGFISDSKFQSSKIELPEDDKALKIDIVNHNTPNNVHLVKNDSKSKSLDKLQNKDVIANDIILFDSNQTLKVQNILLNNQDSPSTELNCENHVFFVPKLSEIIKNMDIAFGHENDENKIFEQCDYKKLDQTNRKKVEDSECGKTENIQSTNESLITFDLDENAEEGLISRDSTRMSVFTSTPSLERHKGCSTVNNACSNTSLFGMEVKNGSNDNINFCSDLTALDNSKELNYSLETWDNFLGRTLDAQNDVQNEHLFDSFSSEPHSLLFIESGNDLVQAHKNNEEENVNNAEQVVTPRENSINKTLNKNNRTFTIDVKNENTFVVEDNQLDNKNGTFTLNKTETSEIETEETVGNSAWGTGGGWFLHPQTSNTEPSGTIEVKENTDSYVGFGIDDEIMAAIRTELLNKLPHAQVAPSEKGTEVEEWDASEKSEVFLKYNIYNPPLSPILEESYIEESDIITPKQESDNEDSEWSEPGLPETTPELESQSVHTYDSQLKGPHHRHTPSQDSCCSNDTLFNLEELTCVAGDVERESDVIKHILSDEFVTETELETIASSQGEQTEELEAKCNDVDVIESLNISTNGNSPKTFDIEKLNSSTGKNYSIEQDNIEASYNSYNIPDDRTIVFETKNMKGSIYISEFITQEIEHSSKQFYTLNEGSSSETNSSLEGCPIVFQNNQAAPLPSPEDNPWKQLPASLLNYEKVISQNNTLLIPTTKSNDVVPENNDLIRDKDTVEPQCKYTDKVSAASDMKEEQSCDKTADSNEIHYENGNINNNQPIYENATDQPVYENIKIKELVHENVKVKDVPQPVYKNVEDVLPHYENLNVSSDIYNEADYVNIVNLENSKNHPINNKKDYAVDSNEKETSSNNDTSQDEDIYGMLTDIKFNGPTENQLISTSFSESNDINDEQDWDSGSDTRSSSSGEFIWKEGEHEESLKALRAAPQDVLEDIKPMEEIAEESTDESDVSSGSSDEEGEVPEFVPSAWDKFATPTKSALRSPEKTFEKSKKKKSKGVWFKKQKYHCVYEYPREPESPVLQSHDLWKPQLDYSSFTDWEFDADAYVPSTMDDSDIFPTSYNYQPKSVFSRNLYQLTSISDFPPSASGLEDEFFVSSSARPFDVTGSLSSQFFPGSANWVGENATPDSGMEDGTPGSSSESSGPSDAKRKDAESVQTLKNLAEEALKKYKKVNTFKNNDALGGLRHTRNKLKLDLPPSPSAFTSTKMFTVEPTLEPVIREKPTFTTFGKSRFSVQHVDTPPEESKNKNVSFEALPHKPSIETIEDCHIECCPDINEHYTFLQEKQILQDKFDGGKLEFIRGEASLLDSADEDSGIESSTLERKLSSDGLLQ